MAEKKNTEVKASEVQEKELLLNLDEYLKTTEVNPGLIASFKAEVLNDKDTPRSSKQWDKDFKNQSNRVYK